MRYLPLSDADRSEMLRVVGAASIDELFRDVPEEARLKGPIQHLPMHASEMAVERHMTALSRKNMVAGEVPFFLGCGAYRHRRRGWCGGPGQAGWRQKCRRRSRRR